MIAEILLAFAQDTSGLALTVDRVWRETPSYTSNVVTNVMVTITNNTNRGYEWVQAECTFTLEGRPVENVTVHAWNVARGQSVTQDARIWGISGDFDGARCRISNRSTG